MTTIVAGAVWTPVESVAPAWVHVEGGSVTAVGGGDPPTGTGPRIDASNLTICPGFIDIHVHGGFGHDLLDGYAALGAVSAALPRHGCTGYLPTTVTASWEQTLAAVSAMADACDRPPRGSTPLGIHLEGPFLNAVRRGMQPAEYMRVPTPVDAACLLHAGRGWVRHVTVAPEVQGGVALVKYLATRGVCVAIAHSDASYEQVLNAAAAGVRHVTHCYNAMRPLHHRDPGVVGAALDLEGLTVEAIADGVHVHPAALRLLWRVKGWRRMALVTDAMAGAGAAEGVYRFGGQDVAVRGGQARLADGTLAGSVLTMDRAVRTMVEAGVPPREAVGMATLSPAEVVGLREVGRIAPGYRADLVALDMHLRVAWTMVGGEVVWRAQDGDAMVGPGWPGDDRR